MPKTKRTPVLSWFTTFFYRPNILATMVVLGTCIICFAIMATSPQPEINDSEPSAINVRVMQVVPQPFIPHYLGYGTVDAKERLTLTAMAEGKLTYLSDNVIEGSTVAIDELVFQQDPTVLKNIVMQRQAEKTIAQAQFDLELGEQQIADNDYQMMKQEFDEKQWQLNLALLLREPQLAQAKAQVSLADAALNIAKNDLALSQWSSPKNYLVASKYVSEGDYLQKGDQIATLIELDEFRVPIYLPRNIAAQVSVGQSVVLSQPDTQFEVRATISHVFPAIENNIHLQKVFAAYSPDSASVTPSENVIIGDFVEARFNFAPIANTITVPLSAIDQARVWLVDSEHRLQQKSVTVLFQDEHSAVIKNVFAAGEQLITHKVHTPRQGLIVNITER
ncbi:efflux RND transporter periplasmic adaptor subunit [Shewanella youngdeokensis]|uniref:HlyD family efflux transporter periplasmic adaptor subunit n=1 Tax=Shewanella youngdeokensis TaxID=2999068 RepID=A0ABZ0JUA8_9GAMM|nr:HlyD family efflux transporter periplasmic adaptor subunit [Shewanella sp. DAU334]